MLVRRYQDADVRSLRRRRWQRDLSAYGVAENEATAVGAAVAATNQRSSGEAIFIGVTTGVLVWTITNILNKLFGSGK